jgi:hypothetical protein
VKTKNNCFFCDGWAKQEQEAEEEGRTHFGAINAIIHIATVHQKHGIQS